MKKIYLVRHAKSSWKDNTLDDSERPLNKRGKRDAPFMGRLLSKEGVKPDLLISSPAKRASETAKYFSQELNISPDDIRFEEKLYLADSNTIIGVIKNLDNKLHTIMLFGHNPGLTDAVNQLSDFHIDNVPTCGIVIIQTDLENWKDTGTKRGSFISFEYPKKYL